MPLRMGATFFLASVFLERSLQAWLRRNQLEAEAFAVKTTRASRPPLPIQQLSEGRRSLVPVV